MIGLAILIFALALVVFFCIASYKDGYAKGQIDAINGKQNYHLLEFPDGTRDYYHKDKFKDFNDENKDYKIIR